MFSLVLSLILACGDGEKERQQQALEQERLAQEEAKKKRKKSIYLFANLGDFQKSFEKGSLFYKQEKDPDLARLMQEVAQRVGDPTTALESLDSTGFPSDMAQNIRFYLLCQKDKQEALAFVDGVTDEEQKAVYLTSLLERGELVQSEHPLFRAAQGIIKREEGAANLLELVEELTNPSAKRLFVSLSLQANRQDLALKYSEALSSSKDPYDQFYGHLALQTQESLQKALKLAGEKNLISDGEKLITMLLKNQHKYDVWPLLFCSLLWAELSFPPSL